MRSTQRGTISIVAAGLFALMAFAGCGKDAVNAPPPGGTPNTGATTFTGTISGATSSGTVDITIATATPRPQGGAFGARATVTATATVHVSGGGAIALTGTYDDVANTISLTGGGWTFTGGLTSFGMEGTYTGPNGTGVFSVQQEGTGTDTVTVFTGTFTHTVGAGTVDGTWNFAIRGTTLHGNAVATTGTVTALDGTFQASTGDVSIVNPAAPGGAPLAIGVIQASGIASGTYDNLAGEAGTWSGQRQ